MGHYFELLPKKQLTKPKSESKGLRWLTRAAQGVLVGPSTWRGPGHERCPGEGRKSYESLSWAPQRLGMTGDLMCTGTSTRVSTCMCTGNQSYATGTHRARIRSVPALRDHGPSLPCTHLSPWSTRGAWRSRSTRGTLQEPRTKDRDC